MLWDQYSATLDNVCTHSKARPGIYLYSNRERVHACVSMYVTYFELQCVWVFILLRLEPSKHL